MTIELVLQGVVDVVMLITHLFPLERMAHVIEVTRLRESHKAIIEI